MTSRPARSNDEPGQYEYIDHTDAGINSLLESTLRGELVQYAVHPTTRYVYATKPSGYPAKYNMLDTQAKVIDSLLRLPFNTSHIIVLVTDPDLWKQWFLTREQKGSEEYTKRLNEAISSLESVLARSPQTVHWIYNQPNNLDSMASDLIEIIKDTKKSNLRNREYALGMLSLAYQMKE